MMHDYGDRYGGTAWGLWWLMALFMIGVIALLVWIAITVARRPDHTEATAPPAEPPRPTPEQILGERLARGEISPDDYRQAMEALRGPSVSSAPPSG